MLEIRWARGSCMGSGGKANEQNRLHGCMSAWETTHRPTAERKEGAMAPHGGGEESGLAGAEEASAGVCQLAADSVHL